MKTFNREKVIKATFQTLYLSSNMRQLTNLIIFGLNVPYITTLITNNTNKIPKIGYCDVNKTKGG